MTEIQPLDIADPIRTQAILRRYGFQFKKSLGQNFLTNKAVLTGILDAADLQPTDLVVEIGPGIGSLTEQLARRVKQVVAVEIDERLLPILADTLAPYDNIEIINQDILKTDLATLTANYSDYGAIKVVANLPYYITTPIMFSLINGEVQPDVLVLMMQKEVAQRITADSGNKHYGSLSIEVQTQMTADIAQIVPRTSFVPQPNVDSAVLVLQRYQQSPYQIEHSEMFATIIKSSFQQRRKSLQNNLANLFGKDKREQITEIIKQLDLPVQVRAEQLPIQKFIDLSNVCFTTFASKRSK
ncbi:16S rRNA (adenine(1518)-N(6)/adenine(1519)-N(6))-dimethyltransferase RsmA [Lapidilactobacillus bayanensis]|uniref:16S rRNA (adenine(1518)-N(6)/adenine(1519)-N(6))- dimethyltransferase RsmA n=1 Tax=Lapidilactobacillus bayanensis TaxID=2485998 RepID=UPI000F7B84A6|nr:16S rRNA (adenine(1518)-N(6)/adenine(1519)-N(6))-dimethyltransferase RsmA [Lapidilactobacillus bayanensis]